MIPELTAGGSTVKQNKKVRETTIAMCCLHLLKLNLQDAEMATPTYEDEDKGFSNKKQVDRFGDLEYVPKN